MFKTVKGLFICGIIFSLTLTSCGNKADIKNNNILGSDTISAEKTLQSEASSVVNTIVKVPDKEGSTKHISITQKKVTIYTIDVQNGTIAANNSMITIKEVLIPEDIIEAVLFELDEYIEIDATTTVVTDKDSIKINFSTTNKDYPFGKETQITEVEVLDCISYSIFENFKDYKKIYFTLNGEAYKSKQLKLSDTEPFMVNG